MGSKFKIFFQAILLSIMAITLSHCSSTKVDENDPAALLKDANEDIDHERYTSAIEKLRMIKNKFSYTTYGALAQLRMGDVYFLQESYPDAATAYETFVDLHPKHVKAGYAMFRIGESYSKDIPDNTERDMRSGDSAVKAFDDYMKRFPNGEYFSKAKDLRKDAHDRLAQKELQIAKFYYKREKYDASMGRIKKILDIYSDTPSAQAAKDLLKSIPGSFEYKDHDSAPSPIPTPSVH